MICFETDFATIKYWANDRILYCSWTGEVNNRALRKIMVQALNSIQLYRPKYWILDIRYMQTIGFNDQQWLIEKWLCNFDKAPFQKVAIINPFDVYNEMVIESFLKAIPENLEKHIQYFPDIESSKAWMQEISEANLLSSQA